jgi:hypothetical protein
VKGNFFKILYTTTISGTKFNFFFLIYCVHLNIAYFDNFIKNISESPLFNPHIYLFIFFKQNLLNLLQYKQLFADYNNVLINITILDKLVRSSTYKISCFSGRFFILRFLLNLFHFKNLNFI